MPWIEHYSKCGCSTEEKYKRDLSGYCAIHGNNFSRRYYYSYKQMTRRTMGQDRGGRRKLNPENAPRVTRQQVEGLAASLEIEIKREGQGIWVYKKGDIWYMLGQTNYIAFSNLKDKAVQEKYNESSQK